MNDMIAKLPDCWMNWFARLIIKRLIIPVLLVSIIVLSDTIALGQDIISQNRSKNTSHADGIYKFELEVAREAFLQKHYGNAIAILEKLLARKKYVEQTKVSSGLDIDKKDQNMLAAARKARENGNNIEAQKLLQPLFEKKISDYFSTVVPLDEQCTSLRSLGEAYFFNGNLDKAKTTYLHYLGTQEVMNQINYTSKSKPIKNPRTTEECISLLRSAEKNSLNPNLDAYLTTTAGIVFRLGLISDLTGSFSDAEALYEISLPHIFCRQGFARIMENWPDILQQKETYNLYKTVFEKVKTKLQNNSSAQAIRLEVLAAFALANGQQWSVAEPLYRKSILIRSKLAQQNCDTTNNLLWHADLLSLNDCMYKLHKPEGDIFEQQALAAEAAFGKNSMVAASEWTHAGKNSIQVKEYFKAVSSLKRAIDIYSKQSNKPDISRYIRNNLNSLKFCYEKVGDFTRASEVSKQITQLSNTVNDSSTK
jgi:tetratricopeptide (TPR) repeat protein